LKCAVCILQLTANPSAFSHLFLKSCMDPWAPNVSCNGWRWGLFMFFSPPWAWVKFTKETGTALNVRMMGLLKELNGHQHQQAINKLWQFRNKTWDSNDCDCQVPTFGNSRRSKLSCQLWHHQTMAPAWAEALRRVYCSSMGWVTLQHIKPNLQRKHLVSVTFNLISTVFQLETGNWKKKLDSFPCFGRVVGSVRVGLW